MNQSQVLQVIADFTKRDLEERIATGERLLSTPQPHMSNPVRDNVERVLAANKKSLADLNAALDS